MLNVVWENTLHNGIIQLYPNLLNNRGNEKKNENVILRYVKLKSNLNKENEKTEQPFLSIFEMWLLFSERFSCNIHIKNSVNFCLFRFVNKYVIQFRSFLQNKLTVKTGFGIEIHKFRLAHKSKNLLILFPSNNGNVFEIRRRKGF